MGLVFTLATLLLIVLPVAARRYSHRARFARQASLSWNRVDTLVARRNAQLRALLAELPPDPASASRVQQALEREERARVSGDLAALANTNALLRQYLAAVTEQPGTGPACRRVRRARVLDEAVISAIITYNQSVTVYNRAHSGALQRYLPAPLRPPLYTAVPPPTAAIPSP